MIFDMDGVITDTAATHREAWRRAFTEHLDAVVGAGAPPFTDDDYRRFVDGRARIDGVVSFLGSRGLALPLGAPGDDAASGTAWGLANRKDACFQEALAALGARAYPTSLDLVRRLRQAGVRTAVVSASRNRAAVLDAAGAADLFDVAVDGATAAELGLPGKPDPAMFLEAARRLGVAPARAVVVEDALAGVEAGRRGDFAVVVGVARGTDPDPYLEHGADTVVTDLAEVAVEGGRDR